MYRVYLQNDAYADLKAWLGGIDDERRAEVLQALQSLYNRLATDPLNEGEGRGGSRRIAFELPVAAIYRVDRHPAAVFVQHIWRVGRRGS